MAVTYSIAPNPHWVIIDNFSKLPPGAAIYTFSHLNPSQYKPAFQDAAGTIPYTQPIDGFENGTFAPIYWAFDPDNLDDSYYIEVWSARKENNGVLLWTFDGLTGSGAGGGGGGGTVTINDIENFVVNGEFYWHADDQPGDTFITLAPSNHASLGGYANVGGEGPPSPDIIFAKGNNSATDSISFVNFTPLGNSDLLPNPTPQLYLNYTCSVAGSSEGYKYIQFPLVKGLQNTSNVTTALRIFARSTSGTTGVQLYYRQFFGNGAAVVPSADVLTPLGGGFLALTSSWQPFDIVSQIVPSIALKNLGDCGNDALYLQVRLPLDSLANVDIALPACYPGKNISTIIFDTLDQVSAITDTPRTGDVRTSLNSFSPFGWVPMNDGTIGDPSSNATTRQNQDTFQLFNLIWTDFQTHQAFAPMFTSGGTPIAYGATAVDDFSAHRQLSLTKNLGRVMAGALPQAASQAFTRSGNTLVVTSSAGFYTGMAVTVNVTGGGLTTGVIYYAIVISSTVLSLATTTANALAGTVIVLGAVPPGTITSQNVEILGSHIGEEKHVQSIAEMPAHTHPGSFGGQSAVAGVSNGCIQGDNATAFGQTLQIASQGGGVGFNIIQPTVYMNVFIKL